MNNDTKNNHNHSNIGPVTSSDSEIVNDFSKEVDKEDKEEKKYLSGKPRRVTIRARIIHDQD